VEGALAVEIPPDAGKPPAEFRYQDASGQWHTVEANYTKNSDGSTTMTYTDTNESTGSSDEYSATYDKDGYMTEYTHDGVKTEIIRENGAEVGFTKFEEQSDGSWKQIASARK
jgi:hypothetical protein